MKFLALFLVTLTAVRAAADPFGFGTGLTPGWSMEGHYLLIASHKVTLLEPATYSAATWSVHGTIELAGPGEYTVVATRGPIALNPTAKIIGPPNSRITFVTPQGFMNEATITGGVTILRARPPGLPPEPAPLGNLSTRTTLAAGQTVSAGFVVGGTTPRRVLIRAIGPTLATFGVSNPLATPTLAISDGRGQVGTNSGWGGAAALATIFSSVGAFALPASSRDAAIVLTLNPGNYTAQVAGGAGEVLTEVYFVP